MDLSTPTLAQIVTACRAAKVSVARVRALAGVDPRSFKTLRAGRARRAGDMLARLADALATIKAGAAPRRKPNATAALVRAIERLLEVEISLARLSGQAVPHTERLKSYAIYLAAVELEIENAELARALGCKRQHIHQTRGKVENWRDDGALAALLDRVADKLRGEP